MDRGCSAHMVVRVTFPIPNWLESHNGQNWCLHERDKGRQPCDGGFAPLLVWHLLSTKHCRGFGGCCPLMLLPILSHERGSCTLSPCISWILNVQLCRAVRAHKALRATVVGTMISLAEWHLLVCFGLWSHLCCSHSELGFHCCFCVLTCIFLIDFASVLNSQLFINSVLVVRFMLSSW